MSAGPHATLGDEGQADLRGPLDLELGGGERGEGKGMTDRARIRGQLERQKVTQFIKISPSSETETLQLDQ